MTRRCKGCGKQITGGEVDWCGRCAPEENMDAATRYEDLIPDYE
jgi:hypothetical protein